MPLKFQPLKLRSGGNVPYVCYLKIFETGKRGEDVLSTRFISFQQQSFSDLALGFITVQRGYCWLVRFESWKVVVMIKRQLWKL